MSQTTLLFLAPPKNQMAHLLRDMIEGKMIAEQQYQYNRFRGSISDLINDYGCPIRHNDVPFTNSFGRESRYRKHYIMEIDREEAINLYEKVNNGIPAVAHQANRTHDQK